MTRDVLSLGVSVAGALSAGRAERKNSAGRNYPKGRQILLTFRASGDVVAFVSLELAILYDLWRQNPFSQTETTVLVYGTVQRRTNCGADTNSVGKKIKIIASRDIKSKRKQRA